MITLTLKVAPKYGLLWRDQKWNFEDRNKANLFFLHTLCPCMKVAGMELLHSNADGAEWGGISYDDEGNEIEDLTNVRYRLIVSEK